MTFQFVEMHWLETKQGSDCCLNLVNWCSAVEEGGEQGHQHRCTYSGTYLVVHTGAHCTALVHIPGGAQQGGASCTISGAACLLLKADTWLTFSPPPPPPPPDHMIIFQSHTGGGGYITGPECTAMFQGKFVSQSCTSRNQKHQGLCPLEHHIVVKRSATWGLPLSACQGEINLGDRPWGVTQGEGGGGVLHF